MSKQYEMGILVMDYLQDLGMSMMTVGTAISVKNLEKSYQLIKNNPQITKAEFLTKMGLVEEPD